MCMVQSKANTLYGLLAPDFAARSTFTAGLSAAAGCMAISTQGSLYSNIMFKRAPLLALVNARLCTLLHCCPLAMAAGQFCTYSMDVCG